MNVVILGAGESGVGAALLAKHLKYKVFVSDKGPIAEKYKKELEGNSIPFEENKHSEKKIFEASEVIKSPGIPDKVDLIQRLIKAGIPVISEIEFAYKHTNATIVAITGSNGKTTTTNLTYHLLKAAHFDVAVGGNIGYSFARLLTENLHQYYVLELSSFQLDGIKTFRSDIAVLLNITPDHLDRYDYQIEKYIASKFRITMCQNANDLFIYNAKDENSLSFLENNKLKAQSIGIVGAEAGTKELVVDNVRFDLSASELKGKHSLFNAHCAIQVALKLGAKKEAIQKGLDSFKNDPHRMETVALKNGVEYINDSKATNVDAVYYALDAMTKPIIWIAGGTDKGNVYDPIIDLAKTKVKALVCLGVDNSKLLDVFSDKIEEVVTAGSMKEAVSTAVSLAEPGDVILLSPACASFDLFKNYIDRGDQFKAAVQAIKDKK